MKTKDLIAKLQECDPSGEIECCVGNADIYFLSQEPAFWDGRLQVLERDHSKDPYYNIIGAKRTSKGRKVVLHPYSIEDYISTNPDSAQIDYSELNEATAASYREADEKVREAMRRIEFDIILGAFVTWSSGILASLKPDTKPEHYKKLCSNFFLKNRQLLEEHHPLPIREEKDGEQIYMVHASIRECEIAHWTNVIEFTQGAWESVMKIKETQ